MTTSFYDLGIEPRYADKLAEQRIASPVRVQQEAIPVIAAGRDAIVRSATGTGKTLAYVLPLLQRIDRESRDLQLIVIVPTQELAMQIMRVAQELDGDISIAALIGGASVQRQLERLKTDKPQVAVGTPGRLLELSKLRKLRLHTVRFAVIDEVDQVFALGGEGDVDALVRAMPRERQLVFVSATLSQAAGEKAAAWMREPARIEGDTLAQAGAAVEHHYTVCDRRDKIDVLRRLLRTLRPTAALVFVNDAAGIGEIEAKLNYADIGAGALYADAGKQERAAALRSFAAGRLSVLIATDVAARGLDIEGLSLIVNFEAPDNADRYVHRAGRTGRMGSGGTVITLATRGEKPLVERMAAKLGLTVREKDLAYGEWVDADGAGSRAGTAARRGGGAGKRGGADAGKRGGGAGKRDGAAARDIGAGERDGTAAASRDIGAGKRAASPATASTVAGPRDIGGDGAGGHAGSNGARPQGVGKSRDRDRDRKNKGAPRWLKDKPDI